MRAKIQPLASFGLAKILALLALALVAITFPAWAGPCGKPGEPACPSPTPVPECGTPGTAPCPGTHIDTFFNTSSGDNMVRLINPSGASKPNVCAMIYVFDSNEEMGECCGCPLSPQKLLSLSVENNLTSDWAIFGGPSHGERVIGLVEVVAAAPDVPVSNKPGVSNGNGCGFATGTIPTQACNGGCDPTNVPGYSTTRALKGYILHDLTPELPEVPFADAGDPDSSTLNYLQEQCGALIGNGTGAGICNCGPVGGE